MKKVALNLSIGYNGKKFNDGDVVELDDTTASDLVTLGFAKYFVEPKKTQETAPKTKE